MFVRPRVFATPHIAGPLMGGPVAGCTSCYDDGDVSCKSSSFTCSAYTHTTCQNGGSNVCECIDATYMSSSTAAVVSVLLSMAANAL